MVMHLLIHLGKYLNDNCTYKIYVYISWFLLCVLKTVFDLFQEKCSLRGKPDSFN